MTSTNPAPSPLPAPSPPHIDYSVASQCIARVVTPGNARALFTVPANPSTTEGGDPALNDLGIGRDKGQPTPTPVSNGPTVPDSFPVNALISLNKTTTSGSLEWQLLAAPNSARAALFSLLHSRKVNPLYPQKVRDETDKWIEDPMIDDPSLEDLTHLPFCTIDNDDSRDLDQAMQIERDGDRGYMLRYALADAAYYVYPGTALFDHALARGTSYYLPRLSVPMLPPALSEDVVSLNANVPRRSLVFHMKLDAQASPVSTTLTRARIISRAKLSYRRVQEYYDKKEPEYTNLSGKDFTETLDLLRVVGALRIKEAESRDVVRYDRVELSIDLSKDSISEFNLTTEKRYDTDRYNEQISLLCNREGAQFLDKEADSHPEVQAIYRVHDAPPENRFGGVDKFIRDLIKVRGLDKKLWDWKDAEDEPVSAYLERLPSSTPEDKRVKAAIERQFLVINTRSTYSGTPGLHYGLGVDPYSRFSSPMREVVGIFTHKEALEKLGIPVTPSLSSVDPKSPEAIEADAALREKVIKSADTARAFQSSLGKAVDSMAIDSFFSLESAKPFQERTRYTGTVMGLVPTRVYVAFDNPPLEIKIYMEDLELCTGKKWEASKEGAGKGSKTPTVMRITGEDWTAPVENKKGNNNRRRGTDESVGSNNGGEKGGEEEVVGSPTTIAPLPAAATAATETPTKRSDVQLGVFAHIARKEPIVVGDKITCVVAGYDDEKKRWAILPVPEVEVKKE